MPSSTENGCKGNYCDFHGYVLLRLLSPGVLRIQFHPGNAEGCDPCNSPKSCPAEADLPDDLTATGANEPGVKTFTYYRDYRPPTVLPPATAPDRAPPKVVPLDEVR